MLGKSSQEDLAEIALHIASHLLSLPPGKGEVANRKPKLHEVIHQLKNRIWGNRRNNMYRKLE